MLLTRAHPDDAERGDIGRQPNRECREDDVPNDGEGELQPGNKQRIEIYGSTSRPVRQPRHRTDHSAGAATGNFAAGLERLLASSSSSQRS